MAVVVLLLIAVVVMPGCAAFTFEARGTDTVPEPAAEKRVWNSAPDPIGIPPGHFPPRGQCRVWHPGSPPGHQPALGSCSVVERGVGLGDWLLYRPTDEKEVVRVSVFDTRTPGVRIAVRVYDHRTGRLLRELQRSRDCRLFTGCADAAHHVSRTYERC